MTTIPTHPTHPSSPAPRRCSDCGRPAWETATVFDHATGSQVTLCGHCALAFLQRQHFSPGCCG